MSGADIPRDEAEATLAARTELGPDYEPAIVDSFVDKVDAAIERRVEEALARRGDAAKTAVERSGDGRGEALALAIVSLALSIPLTAIMAGEMGSGGIIMVWAAIVVINIAFNIRR